MFLKKSIRNLRGRSIRLDAYILGNEDDVFNVEIQRSDNCNHVKRVRYNASLITIHNSEPGDDFDDIQTLCMIYITEFDIFKGGLPIYHVKNTIQETGDVIDNGLTEIYVNTEINDDSKVAQYMSLFHKTELDSKDKKIFPNTYKKFHSIKHDKKEVGRMCEKIQDFAKKEAIYSAIESYDDCGVSKEIIIEKIMKRFNLEKEIAEKYYDDVFVIA